MKIHILSIFTFLFFIAHSCFSQSAETHSLYLKTGTFYPASNINQHTIDSINLHSQKWQNKIFIYIQFLKTPGAGERKILSAAGIELLNYLPRYTYLASVQNSLSIQVLNTTKAIAIFQLSPSQKLHPALASGIIPPWAQTKPGSIDLLASFPKSLTLEEIQHLLNQKNIEIIDQQFSRYHVIGFRIAKDRLLEIAAFSFLEYIEPVPHPDQPLNFSSQAYSAARVLSAGSGVGGKDLDGEGVVVGVGDNANIISHIDFTNRVIDRSAVATNETHGKHVSGTVAGAGIREEKNTGFAPGATIISQTFSRIITNAPAYVNDHNMVVTNNSYGAVTNNCEYAGYYDLISSIMDQQAFDMPNLQHVFAAGNDGTVNCSPFPLGFQTVLGSFQSSKNVITVGGMNYTNSSKGPVKDGRVKPEITAQGSGIVSTGNNNGYFSSTGTSNSAPAVSGGLALLYQQYREQNGNLDPKSGLMKALICNGAADIGNPGPDFRNGYGLMNLRRSSEMLENEHYFIASIAQGNNNIHTIPGLPPGTAQIKVMLYWHDPSASGLSAITLVNDLDLELITPSSSVVLPGILDASAANVQNNSVTGIDQLNNMEQVVINNPEAGNYSVSVKGMAINQNPQQEYFLVYDIIPSGIELTHPIGGEALIPAETILITWEDASVVANTFTIEVSTDNGSNWTSYQSAAGVRFYNWAVPNIPTNQALVRITNNGTGAQNISQPFTILGRPTVSLAAVQCESYINLTWTAVTGATQYEVMRLSGKKMVSVFLTPDATTLQHSLGGLAKDSVYWVSVRAINNGIPGRRALAVSRMPVTGTCSGTLSDYDLKIDSILSPKTGRTLSSTALTSSEDLIIRVKNLDDAVAPDFTVSYTINGMPGGSQQITTGLAGGAFTDVLFPGIDLSALGDYTIAVSVINNAIADPVTENNELSVIIKHLPNEEINLDVDFLDNIEAAEQRVYNVNQTGLEGADRYDFQTTHQNNGRLRTFFSSGISYSGSNAFTLDASNYTNPAVTNFLSGTYNLVNYDATIDDLRLDFLFKHHGQYANSNNRVWIRGNDNPLTPWIEVYDLSLNQTSAGVYKRSASLELGDILVANGQNFSTSFQARWGQEGVVMASDNTWGNGYSFDDIKLYKAVDDIQLLSIDEPTQVDCGLSAAAQVTVTLRNSANQAINNVPISLNVNNGGTITEIIPVINGNETISYSFTTPVNLSAFGNHEIVSWVDLVSDNYRANDTVRLQFINSPIISDFPYLENFETSEGYWHASGINSSWEYGIPASSLINQAASGTKAWKTNLDGNYNNDEYSYLYSPCFDITGLNNPALSFSLALDIEDCGTTLCDAAFIEYSIDGNSWMRLGDASSGVNWYNKNYAGNTVWSIENYTRWHVVTVSLPINFPALRLRIAFRSDPGVTREGMAIDDIHIYDNNFGIYDGLTMDAAVTQPVSGTDWVHFTENGQLIASILPGGQDLGNTAVQTYINEGAVRFMSGQYYHDRNITIKPANTIIPQPVRVRFYFMDDETENLINASGCGACSKPISGYGLGVSKFTHTDKNLENGTTADNNGGEWLFKIPDEVDIIPFDKGYYAEFEVQNFSEFWLNDGGPAGTTPLPVKLLSFTAKKQNDNDVSLQWVTATENDLDRFEIELAKGNNNLQINNFEKIGFVSATGNSTQQINYEHIDREPGKNTARFYRLKMVDRDGRFVYSPVRSVIYGISQNWKVHPNPSDGAFNLIFQANEGSKLKIQLSDALGRILKNWEPLANGFEQKFNIDLTENIYPGGVYFIMAEVDNQQKVFRIIKK